MDIQDLIPVNDLPKSGVLANLTTAWLGVDNEADYRARGGHPTYDETSIEYRFNSRGYRCPEFTERADIRMISIGCSNAAGDGLPQDAIFHELFAERLRRETGQTVVNWNLAEAGISNDVIERVLQIAVPILDPHLVLILFTEMGRREYISPRGLQVAMVPALVKPHSELRAVIDKYVRYGPDMKIILGNLGGLMCEQDDELRFFRSYKSVEALLTGRSYVFGFTDSWPERRHVFKHLDAEKYAGSLGRLDLARDGIHSGPKSHTELAGKFWNAFERIRGRDGCVDLEGAQE